MTDTAELTDADMAEIVGGKSPVISKLLGGGTAQERVYEKIGMCGCGKSVHD